MEAVSITDVEPLFHLQHQRNVAEELPGLELFRRFWPRNCLLECDAQATQLPQCLTQGDLGWMPIVSFATRLVDHPIKTEFYLKDYKSVPENMVETPMKFSFNPTCHYGEIGHLQNCMIMQKLMVAILDFEKSSYLPLIFLFYKKTMVLIFS